MTDMRFFSSMSPWHLDCSFELTAVSLTFWHVIVWYEFIKFLLLLFLFTKFTQRIWLLHEHHKCVWIATVFTFGSWLSPLHKYSKMNLGEVFRPFLKRSYGKESHCYKCDVAFVCNSTRYHHNQKVHEGFVQEILVHL